jgi:hypothetical protein
MSRVVVLTPIESNQSDDDVVEVNLDHVLWMEPRPEGTLLFLNDIRTPGTKELIINSSVLVVESAREILCAMEDEGSEAGRSRHIYTGISQQGSLVAPGSAS